MYFIGYMLHASAMTEREIQTQQGTKVLASIEVTVNDGSDTAVFELNDDNARAFANNLATGAIDGNQPVIVNFNFKANRSEKDGSVRYFNKLRANSIQNLCKKGGAA